MELRVLKYFLAVVNAGTVTKAARVLHVTQPTLSRQLMDLEDELGQKLFVRSNHTITLTQEGILFRRRAEESAFFMPGPGFAPAAMSMSPVGIGADAARS